MSGRSRVFAAVVALTAVSAFAQTQFQIVWVRVGEAAAVDASGADRTGRNLFAGSDLATLSIGNVRVSRVDVNPVVSNIKVGETWCLGALDMRAFGADQSPVFSAPLTITVRQDHRPQLQLRRSREGICVTPNEAGEYPIRFTSLLPAPDGSMRGAQVFLRVQGVEAPLTQAPAHADAFSDETSAKE